jgi:hypothetical protein
VRERYTHYPVPSEVTLEVTVRKELERTSGVDMIFIFACTEAMNGKHRINMSHHVRYRI